MFVSNKKIIPTNSSNKYLNERENGEDVSISSDNEDEEESVNGDISMYEKIHYWWQDNFSSEVLKRKSRWILDVATIDISLSVEDISFLMTLYILFAEDIMYLVGNPSSGSGVEFGITVCFFFFVFELLINTWARTSFRSLKSIYLELIQDYKIFRGDANKTRFRVPLIYPKFQWDGYFLSYFWILDVIVIISLFPDIPRAADSLRLYGCASNFCFALLHTIRLVRVLRVIRTYCNIYKRRHQRKLECDMLQLVSMGSISFEEELKRIESCKSKSSKLGQQLAVSTTIHVTILIFVLLIIFPLFIFTPKNQVYDFSTEFFQAMSMDSSLTDNAKMGFIDIFIEAFEDYPPQLISLNVYPYSNNSLYNNNNLLEKTWSIALLNERLTQFNTSKHMYYSTTISFSLNSELATSSLSGILLVLFIGLLLVIGNSVFTNDTNNIVLAPIERMMVMVQAVAKDPLSNYNFNREDEVGSYETNLLEKSFVKIAGLLRVGFGEAGAGIIKHNLALNNAGSSSAIINPLLPGIRVYCIVGFCYIHDFEFVTQKLEKDVLSFVNTIATIVHENVHEREGSCNKNLGNAFVIIWRIGEESEILESLSKSQIRMGSGSRKKDEEVEDEHGSGTHRAPSRFSSVTRRTSSTKIQLARATSSKSLHSAGNSVNRANARLIKSKYHQVDLRKLAGVDQLAAKALIAYLKIIAEINRNPQVLAYSEDPRLNIPGEEQFRVRMGFGLHAGWAIEGAVGSLEKVDATYLSPHVNMAARLETSSKQYSVPLLASQNFYDLLSPHIQKYMRRLDVVTVKGSENPIGIYTYDACQDQVFESLDSPQSCNLTATTNPLSDCRMTIEIQSNVNTEGSSANGNQSKDFTFSTKTRRLAVQRRFSDENAIISKAQEMPEELFNYDVDLVALRKHITEAFMETFNKGVNCYVSGDWENARMLLLESNEIMKFNASNSEGDGPSLTLLRYMESYHFLKPSGWDGYRPLTSK